MEGEEVADPLELNKNSQIIKDAQEEIGKLDVLVCGECHDVFHYIEAFQEHRQQKEKCTKVSTVRDNYKTEPKAQIWAFMLWKCAQQRKAKEGEPIPTSWAIYQRWCKLNSDYKDAWVVAGHAIQSFTKLSTAKVQEIKTKTTGTPVRNKTANVNKNNDEDPLEEGEIRLSQLTNAQRVAIKAQVASNKANVDLDPLAGGVQKKDAEGDTEKDGEKTKKNNDATKKTPFKPVQIGNDVTKTDSKKALRTNKDDTTEEATIDRIVSRRFNHKKKSLEYLIKWESMNESENTWEPKPHLEKCKWLMEEFDRLFNKPKSNAKLQKKLDESHSEQSEAEESMLGRPQRTSKQKALNQVKVWCGDITDGDEASGKRKSFSDDDSSDSFEKKIKLEEETDSSDDEKPSVTIRRVIKSANSVNGIAKKPDGTLNTTPQRVLRVSQKQLPSLSSGVYIMSKTEGIIKLDSNTPPTVSNPLLRVGPKIGQTHIKVVKKDGGPSTNVQKTPTKLVPKLIRTTPDSKSPGSTLKPTNRILQQQRKIATSTPKLPIKVVELNINDKADLNKDRIDEDSDGLEELEFPTDLPLPSPDSPPGEFTLCPLTGKLVGHDYPEEKPESTLPENTSLDNLVKEAVAELPDIDVDTDTGTLVTNDLKPDKPDDGSIPSIEGIIDSNSQPTSIIVTPSTSESSPVVTIAVSVDSNSTATLDFNDIVPPATTAATITSITESTSTASILSATITSVAASTNTTLSKVTPTITKQVRSSPSSITTAIISNSKIPLKDDLEECIASNTIQRNNSSSLITSSTKPKPKGTTSILNAALTNTRVTQSPSHVGPTKKLLSTPSVRQKVTTTINRSPISRPSIARPSPTATIIQKVTPSRQRTVLPKTAMHPEPVLKRTSHVNTYSRPNVSGKIGGTTIYKASEKPQLTTVKKIVSAPVASTVSTIVATIAQPTLVQASQPPALVQTSTPHVINMPLLTTDEEQPTASNNVTSINEIETLPTLSAETGMTDLSTFSLTDSETPLLITGDDGTVYQVAGQNEEGQTILISEGPDGQQQCVLVSSEPTTEEPQTIMMDTGSAEPDELEQALMINTQPEEAEAEVAEESNQVVAQIIKADPPSPGGTRKVVLMLPDGNLMMTDVTAEQYAALELDK